MSSDGADDRPWPPHSSRMLVTGGCGFIGSNFLGTVVPRFPDCTFVNIDIEDVFSEEQSLPPSVRCASNYRFVLGNVNDYDLVAALMKTEQFTHIVHFAAHSHVDSSFDCGKNVLAYTSDNVGGTHVLLEAARRVLDSPLFLHFSTDEVYGDNQGLRPHSEQDVLRPTNPYAASKACAEMYVHAYSKSYSTRAVVVRCNNVFGPGQHKDKLVPKFLDNLRAGRPCPIHGKGHSLRSFLYVSDAVAAVLLLMQKGSIGSVYNLDSPEGNERDVLGVVQALSRLLGLKDETHSHRVVSVPDRPYNDKRYFIDGRAARVLGWEPVVGFEEGLQKIIDAPA